MPRFGIGKKADDKDELGIREGARKERDVKPRLWLLVVVYCVKTSQSKQSIGCSLCSMIPSITFIYGSVLPSSQALHNT